MAEYVYPFLNHTVPEARRGAVMALGVYWSLPEYKELLETIWREDPDDLVRSTALNAWVLFYFNSKDIESINKLVGVLKNGNEELLVLSEALTGIFNIAGLKPKVYGLEKIHRINDYDEFNQMIPWNVINDLVIDSK